MSCTEESLSLDSGRQSIRPFLTKDEYLYAMKEDLAEWFNLLYQININVDNFFSRLETGELLCHHANHVQSFILQRLERDGEAVTRASDGSTIDAALLGRPVVFRHDAAHQSTFVSRDNVSNFIEWCRRVICVRPVLLFETDDLVLRKNERSVVLCLLEVARRGARWGMQAPQLVKLEQEIDAEIAADERGAADHSSAEHSNADHSVTEVHLEGSEGAPPCEAECETVQQPPAQRRNYDLMSLDEMVRELVGQCTCPDAFPVIKVSNGKYKVGESQTLIFVRILRKHVMVRIGGGWDTLENYLDRHDPCRCQNKTHGRTGTFGVSPKRRSSVTVTNFPKASVGRRTSLGSVSCEQTPRPETSPNNRIALSKVSNEKSPSPPTNSAQLTSSTSENSGSFNKLISKSGAADQQTLSTEHKNQTQEIVTDNSDKVTIINSKKSLSYRKMSMSEFDRLKKQSSTTKPFVSPSTAATVKNKLNNVNKLNNKQTVEYRAVRSRVPKSRERVVGMRPRSRSFDHLFSPVPSQRTGSAVDTSRDTLMVSRDESGRHRIADSGLGSSDTERRDQSSKHLPATVRPATVLPNKPSFSRSLSHNADENKETILSERSNKPRNDDTGKFSRVNSDSKKPSDLSSNISKSNFDQYPEAPPEDQNLYREMEKLFEQYRIWELERSSQSENKSELEQQLQQFDQFMNARIGNSSPLNTAKAASDTSKARQKQPVNPSQHRSSSNQPRNPVTVRRAATSISAKSQVTRPLAKAKPLHSSDSTFPQRLTNRSQFSSKVNQLSRESPAAVRHKADRSRLAYVDSGSGDDLATTSDCSAPPMLLGRQRSMSSACADDLRSVSASTLYDKQLTLDHIHNANRYKASPRKDRVGGATRIPLPVSQQGRTVELSEADVLKRCDSGVDINNMSPTGSSVHGDDLGWCHRDVDSCDTNNQDIYY